MVGTRTDMPENFLKVEIADPHQANRVLWESLSPKKRTWLDERQFCSREFEALDQRRFSPLRAECLELVSRFLK